MKTIHNPHIPGDDLDDYLLELVLKTQRSAPDSLVRKELYRKILNAILNSGRMQRRNLRSQHVYLGHPRFDECYEEAISRASVWLYQNIDRYDPSRGPVMRWFNFHLAIRHFRDAVTDVLGLKPKKSEVRIGDAEIYRRKVEETPDPLSLQMRDEVSYADLTRDYITEDPDALLATKVMSITVKEIFKEKLKGKTMREIAQNFNLKPTTLAAAWRRNLKAIELSLGKYAENHY